LDRVVVAGHRYGGTVNDVVVAAVTGAVLDILHARGEAPRRIVVSVPVSGRRTAGSSALGNDIGVLPLSVSAIVDDTTRLAEIVTATTTARRTAVRASSAPAGWVV
jgi:diacylglycerol O-acyltransferase / wax synthase